jgi:hypothetical protein
MASKPDRFRVIMDEQVIADPNNHTTRTRRFPNICIQKRLTGYISIYPEGRPSSIHRQSIPSLDTSWLSSTSVSIESFRISINSSRASASV